MQKQKPLSIEEKSNLEFYKLQVRLSKKLKERRLHLSGYIPPKPKPKESPGFMNDIGEIFECNYNVPGKPKQFSNT